MREPYDREIAALRQMIEQSIGRNVTTPADFVFLRETIAVRCQDTLSDSTLKRIWGYVKGYGSTNAATLSLLARCVGFRDWEDFLENHSRSGDSSSVVLGRSIATSELVVDSTMTITWAPDRRVLLRHLENGNFVVLESANSKLKHIFSVAVSLLSVGICAFAYNAAVAIREYLPQYDTECVDVGAAVNGDFVVKLLRRGVFV